MNFRPKVSFMYKLSLVLVAVVASIPCAAFTDNDQATISLTAGKTLSVSRNRELVASPHAMESAQADRLTAGQRLNRSASLSMLSIDSRRNGAHR